MPVPFVKQAKAKADPLGVAMADISPGGNVDWVIQTSNVDSDSVKQSSGVAYVDGFQRDTTDTGNSDTSDTRIVLVSTAVYRFIWSGCTPGANCTVVVHGVQYAIGQAPWE